MIRFKLGLVLDIKSANMASLMSEALEENNVAHISDRSSSFANTVESFRNEGWHKTIPKNRIDWVMPDTLLGQAAHRHAKNEILHTPVFIREKSLYFLNLEIKDLGDYARIFKDFLSCLSEDSLAHLFQVEDLAKKHSTAFFLNNKDLAKKLCHKVITVSDTNSDAEIFLENQNVEDCLIKIDKFFTKNID